MVRPVANEDLSYHTQYRWVIVDHVEADRKHTMIRTE